VGAGNSIFGTHRLRTPRSVSNERRRESTTRGPLKRGPLVFCRPQTGSDSDALPGNRPSCLSGSAAHLQSSNGPEPQRPRMIESILSPTHLLLILVVALIVLGPKRLAEAAAGLARRFAASRTRSPRPNVARSSRDPAGSRARSHARRLDVGGRDPNGSVSRQHPRPATPTCQASQRKDAA
jgi:hypothetical protein